MLSSLPPAPFGYLGEVPTSESSRRGLCQRAQPCPGACGYPLQERGESPIADEKVIEDRIEDSLWGAGTWVAGIGDSVEKAPDRRQAGKRKKRKRREHDCVHGTRPAHRVRHLHHQVTVSATHYRKHRNSLRQKWPPPTRPLPRPP